MTKIGIFYGSTTGNTEDAAESIKAQLNHAEINDIRSTRIEKMLYYDLLILGSSTWGVGDVQTDWEDILDDLQKLDLNGKKVAFFGTGDQITYNDTFCNALGTLYETLQNSGVELIGKCSTDTYEFLDSSAVKNGMFVGLPLDEDNQSELTAKRIEDWVTHLKTELKDLSIEQ